MKRATALMVLGVGEAGTFGTLSELELGNAGGW